MTGKKILLGITGSIAAYKAPVLVRLLLKAGAEVKVIMTPAAASFVSPLTLATLTKHPVLMDLFKDETWANHVALGRWADVMLVTPLSCNSLSKMAAGACDNLLLATYLSATCPVVVAPAMDEDMWKHPSTQRALSLIQKDGCRVIDVGYGELASGLVGQGRMAEVEEIVEYIKDFFKKCGSLTGKKALVTAGPTYEAIDPVRFIGNHSSGKMGVAIANELQRRGADVILVAGPMHIATVGLKRVDVQSASGMFDACMEVEYDIAVMSAAVADYTPVQPSGTKLKKSDNEFELRLTKTKDILSALGGRKKSGQVLVGFALETDNEHENALKKLKAKNADMIVLNSLQDKGAGFGYDTNKVTFYFRDGREKAFALQSKRDLATNIVDAITELLP